LPSIHHRYVVTSMIYFVVSRPQEDPDIKLVIDFNKSFSDHLGSCLGVLPCRAVSLDAAHSSDICTTAISVFGHTRQRLVVHVYQVYEMTVIRFEQNSTRIKEHTENSWPAGR
jgi:hypothetical protein